MRIAASIAPLCRRQLLVARTKAAFQQRALATTASTLPSSTPEGTKETKPAQKKKHLIFGNRGPSLQDFLSQSNLKENEPKLANAVAEDVPYLSIKGRNLGAGAKYFVEVYGCQMNVNDTEILMSIMNGAGYTKADDQADADIIFLVTCAIRENAETRIWNRLGELKRKKMGPQKDRAPLVGVLGVSAQTVVANPGQTVLW